MSKMLDRVSKILNQAENAGTPEEAEVFMAKAQELATINGIDLAIARLHQAKKEKASEPEERRIQINPFNRRHNRKHFIELSMAIADVNDVKYLIGSGDYTLFAIGFPEDIDMLEALYAHLAIQMVLECDAALKRGDNRSVERVPVMERHELAWEDRDWGGWNGRSQYYDDDPDYEVFCYRQQGESKEDFEKREREEILKGRARYEEAIKKGEDVYSTHARGGNGGYRKPVPPPSYYETPVLDADGKMKFEEKEHAIVDGRVFRSEFYQAFISRIRGRLWEIRRSVEKDLGIERESSSETALAIRDKKEAVEEEYRERVQHTRGTWKDASETRTKYDHTGTGRQSGLAAAERVPIHEGREVDG